LPVSGITEQQLINAKTDAESLEAIVNGGPTQTVSTRLGRSIKTLAKTLADMEALTSPPAVAENTSSINHIENAGLGTSIFIYIDAVNGSDAGDGSFAAPIQTMSELGARLVQGRRHIVRLLSDFDFDYRVEISGTILIQFEGRSTDNSALQNRTINGVNSTNVPTRTGGIALQRGCAAVQFNTCTINLNDPTSGVGFLEIGNGLMTTSFYSCSFSKSASNIATMLHQVNHSLMTAFFSASAVTPIAGKVANGIASGSDPALSATRHYRSNISAW